MQVPSCRSLGSGVLLLEADESISTTFAVTDRDQLHLCSLSCLVSSYSCRLSLSNHFCTNTAHQMSYGNYLGLTQSSVGWLLITGNILQDLIEQITFPGTPKKGKPFFYASYCISNCICLSVYISKHLVTLHSVRILSVHGLKALQVMRLTLEIEIKRIRPKIPCCYSKYIYHHLKSHIRLQELCPAIKNP